jgi:tetratricopeptide (TPR) repeat protein
MLVTLPFVLLLLDYWSLGRFAEKKQPPGKGPVKSAQRHQAPAGTAMGPAVFRWATVRPLLVEKVPFFLLAGLSCVVTYYVQQHGGMMRGMEIVPLTARLANALVAYAAYMGKMVWPADLAMLYPHPVWWPFWRILFALVLLAAITLAVLIKTRRYPYLAVGWLWYTGTLIPVIGIVQVGSQAMADRYTYIPLVGLFIVVVWGIPELLARLPRRREALAALSALCLVCLFLQTWKQVSYWHDNITLYNHALAVTGRNGAIRMNRGTAYFTLGDYRAAIEDLSRAIEIDPEFAPAYLNRGTAYEAMGDYAKAIADFNKALEINPRYALAYHNRAIVCGALGDHARALETATGEKGPEIEHMTETTPQRRRMTDHP